MVVVGAGIGGLAAAAELAARGLEVTVLDAAGTPGGKLRQARVGPAMVDAGPTVLTMPWVFEELFERAGDRFSDHVSLAAAPVLARHAWPDGSRLDLFANRDDSASAIADFAGAAEAGRFLGFCERAARTYQALEAPFIRAPRSASPLGLLWRGGIAGLPGLARIEPFSTLWSSLCRQLHDPRLRQLFGRYATYCGASPFSAPATLMLVAHVEQQGVWLVQGGMVRVAEAVAALAERHGCRIRTGSAVRRVMHDKGKVRGVETAQGEVIPADVVVFNGDAAALPALLEGRSGGSPQVQAQVAKRSLSAVTWTLVARAQGFPLQRHNVFFSADSATEFRQLFGGQGLPSDPTVYVCAQDRGIDDADPGGPERLLCLANAAATGDTPQAPSRDALARLEAAVTAQLARHGLALDLGAAQAQRMAPQDFDRLYPGTGGALYGRASHGWRASFDRPGARTRIAGLYRAGGSTHPGPGVPMAALSGHQAAQCVFQQLGMKP